MCGDGVEPTSLAFQTNALPLSYPHGSCPGRIRTFFSWSKAMRATGYTTGQIKPVARRSCSRGCGLSLPSTIWPGRSRTCKPSHSECDVLPVTPRANLRMARESNPMPQPGLFTGLVAKRRQVMKLRGGRLRPPEATFDRLLRRPIETDDVDAWPYGVAAEVW